VQQDPTNSGQLTLAHKSCIIASMKWLILTVTILTLEGCAYTVASTVSLVSTGKSATDHILTQAIPNSNCSSLQVLDGKYYCEIDDPTQHYNRAGY